MDVTSDTIEPARPQALHGTANHAESDTKLTQVARWRAPVLASTPQVQPSRNPSLPTFAGLMTLILTFFIVLTSISLHDKTKSDQAIASVQEAFGNAVPIEAGRAQTDEEILHSYLAGLTQRIQSLVPLMGGKPAPAADHQVLWLPVELAFSDQGATLAPAFPTVLREIVHAMGGIPQRLAPRIELRLCATGPSDQLRARAVSIGSALAGERAPLRQFSIGVASCDPRNIGIAVALIPAPEGQAP